MHTGRVSLGVGQSTSHATATAETDDSETDTELGQFIPRDPETTAALARALTDSEMSEDEASSLAQFSRAGTPSIAEGGDLSRSNIQQGCSVMTIIEQRSQYPSSGLKSNVITNYRTEYRSKVTHYPVKSLKVSCFLLSKVTCTFNINLFATTDNHTDNEGTFMEGLSEFPSFNDPSMLAEEDENLGIPPGMQDISQEEQESEDYPAEHMMFDPTHFDGEDEPPRPTARQRHRQGQAQTDVIEMARTQIVREAATTVVQQTTLQVIFHWRVTRASSSRAGSVSPS